MQRLRSLLLLFIVLFVTSARAERESALLVGSGLLAYDTGRSANDSTRVPYGFSDVYVLPLHVVGFLRISERLALSPHALYTVIPSPIADGAGTTTAWYVGLPVAYQFGKSWDVRLGAGLYNYTITGLGGKKTGANGTGTATFGLPSGSVSTKNYVIEFGIGQTFGLLNGSLDVLLFNIGNTDKRAVTFLLTFNYALLGG